MYTVWISTINVTSDRNNWQESKTERIYAKQLPERLESAITTLERQILPTHPLSFVGYDAH